MSLHRCSRYVLSALFSAAIFTHPVLGSPANTNEANKYYEKALEEYQNEKIEEAYIHLKNSLKNDANYLPAKILMGKVMMASGYYNEAEVEFEEALAAGGDVNVIVAALGRTWLFLEKYDKILQAKFQRLNKTGQVEWHMILATTHANLGKTDQARKLYKQVLKTTPSDIRVLQAITSLELAQNNYTQAQEYLTRALEVDSTNTNGWRLQGELYMLQGEQEKAIAALEQGFSLKPDDMLIKRSLVSAYLQTGERQKASDLLDKILAQTPDDPNATLIQAWLSASAENNQQARSALETLSANLARLPEAELTGKPELLYISALSAYAQNNFEQARGFFSQFLNQHPEHTDAQLLLSETLLKLGRSKEALAMLAGRERELSGDLDSALLLSELYLRNNKAFKAVELISLLKPQYPDNRELELLEIKTFAARKKYSEALALLNKSAHINTDVSFILAKSMLLLESGQLEQANQIADQLVAIDENVDFLNYKAAVLIKMQRYTEAAYFIDRVLKDKPQHYSARFNQATVLGANGQFEPALELLNQLHQEQPNNISTQISLARIQTELGQLDTAISGLQQVLEQNIGQLQATELLANLMIQTNRVDEALGHLDILIKSHPTNYTYLLQRIELYLAKEQTARVERELKKVARIVADQPQGLLRLAQVQLAAQKFADAKKSINTATKLDPNNRALAIESVRLHLHTQDLAEADTQLNKLQTSYPNDAEISLLKGDVLLAKQQLEAAAKAYLTALGAAPDLHIALVRLYQLTLRQVGLDSFGKEVNQLVERFPDDHFKRSLLADHLMNLGKHQQALPHYEKLVKVPELKNRAYVLNNLANIYLRTDLEKAQTHVEQALEIDSKSAAILDTQGWIQALSGNLDEALVILRRAFSMNAGDPAIRYHLGYTLHKLGRLSEARNELSAALTSTDRFAEREDAQALLNSI